MLPRDAAASSGQLDSFIFSLFPPQFMRLNTAADLWLNHHKTVVIQHKHTYTIQELVLHEQLDVLEL